MRILWLIKEVEWTRRVWPPDTRRVKKGKSG
jgi:hypothetical protein